MTAIIDIVATSEIDVTTRPDVPNLRSVGEAEIIEMSGAAIPHRQWLTRATLARLYAYPFLELRCQMVVMRVPADNEYLLGILARYGYVFYRIARLFGSDRDGVVCTLTYEDWIDNKFNQPRIEQMKEAA